MKQEEFEHTLKQLSGNFSLPVSNKMFDAVAEKRKKERRKRKFLAWMGGCSVAAALMFFAVFYFIPSGHPGSGNNNSTVLHENFQNTTTERGATHARTEGKTAAGENIPHTMPAGNNTAVSDQTKVKNNGKPGYSRNNIAPGIERSARHIPFFTAEGTTKKTVSKSKITTKQTLGSVHSDKPAENKSTNTNASDVVTPQDQPGETTGNDQGIVMESSDTHRENNDREETGAVTKKEETAVKPLIPPQTDMAGANNTGDSVVKPVTNEVTKPRKWMMGFYGDYTPVTSARNSNAAIPLPHTDSLGLSDKAKYAFSAGLKFGYLLSDRWTVSIGLGYHQVQFDEVRFASNIKIDSTHFESITSSLSGNLKNADGYYYAYNISDRSLGWMQVPLSVSYTATPQKRVSFYAQAGINYQLLVKSKGYEFTSWNDSLKYEEVTDKASNRINKHQFALFIEPGVKIHITPRIQYQVGLTYRRHLTSLYRKEYQHNSPAYYFGLSSALNFIF
jgi:hypothetical protein